MKAALLALALVMVGAGLAEAYPQYTLSREPTCSGCHLAPGGGGLLNENGLAQAEAISQFGGAPEFFYGKVPTPSWLQLGGDFRASGGYLKTPENALAAFPMQLEAYAQATFGHLSLHLTVGGRPTREGHELATSVWSREHYVQWALQPGAADGLFVRAGRFLPVFGLRFAEHTMYTRRYGGTQLYADTYGLAVEYIQPRYELHATGFVADRLIVPVERASGAAVYGELRVSTHFALGLEAMAKLTSDDARYFYGATAKYYFAAADVLLQAEGQFVNQMVDETVTNPAGGAPLQLVGNVVATKLIGDFVMVDLGIGHFDSNVRIKDLDRDCVDLNVHYFLTSHVELALNARYEALAFGKGGDPGAYVLGQLHYRL